MVPAVPPDDLSTTARLIVGAVVSGAADEKLLGPFDVVLLNAAHAVPIALPTVTASEIATARRQGMRGRLIGFGPPI
jgi:hypothetical protein